MSLHPAEVERRLLELEKLLNDAQDDLEAAEAEYATAKAQFEINMAKQRLSQSGAKKTVQEKEDTALVACETQAIALSAADAWVRGARANMTRIRTQVDIARSLGAGIRTAMEM